MVLPIEAPNDKSAPAFNIARIRDYWLGGVHHAELDRKYADHIMVCAPQVPYLVREQRAMVRRMVRYLVQCGVRQFLDLGSGVPTMGYVHEVAQAADPQSRVLYVDIDPHLVRDGQELLRDNENADYLEADIRRVDDVLGAPRLRELLDLSRPVAVLMIETLLHIPDTEEPAAMVAGYVDALCSGSYLGISHFSATTELMNGFMLFAQMFGVPPVVTLREPEQVAEFFTGLELVPPGLVPLPLWRPDPGDDPQRNADRVRVPTGLARKPGV
ncbi:MAG TPA: SAM-dependent methyltransferase [Actinophytocola sp.]|uniref:SAM-dependent methyltransferase n=1 Tax=Actinophytocola sp. TaxID=1872138 RepID=UPI002DDD0254|nr:SAM-dependent methyltransferase [Actinophytocola sp.]HEV2781779.1 SAM-dependent methyltransferase [Actinophytocola sp.]